MFKRRGVKGVYYFDRVTSLRVSCGTWREVGSPRHLPATRQVVTWISFTLRKLHQFRMKYLPTEKTAVVTTYNFALEKGNYVILLFEWYAQWVLTRCWLRAMRCDWWQRWGNWGKCRKTATCQKCKGTWPSMGGRQQHTCWPVGNKCFIFFW